MTKNELERIITEEKDIGGYAKVDSIHRMLLALLIHEAEKEEAKAWRMKLRGFGV